MDSAATSAAANTTAHARSSGFTGWGVLLIVVGALTALVTLGMLAIALAPLQAATTANRARGVLPAHPPAANSLIRLAIAFVLGAAFVWTGIDTIRRRRWVRAIILIGTALVIACGVLDLVAITIQLPDTLDGLTSPANHYRGSSVPLSTVIAGFCVHVIIVLGVAVVLPRFMWGYFHRADVRDALAASNPRPSWTERCPVVVLAWAGFCAVIGVGTWLGLLNPIIPLFTFVLSGTVAAITRLVLGVVLLWGAWLCFRLDRLGLILTSVVVTALHASIVTFLWTGGTPADLNPELRAARYQRQSHVYASRQPAPTPPPQFVALTTATLEALLILGLDALAAREFVRGWRVAIAPGSVWEPINWRARRPGEIETVDERR